ncbi:MAG: DUF4304 domain-containing protein [Kofleriaceae bacterium]|nr:DUF4304 domain-containing protein [Kofleriaceae bacterium]
MGVSKREIEQSVLTPLRNAGWRRHGRSAYLDGPELSVVVNIQGSPYDGLQYVNVAFWFPAQPGEQLAHHKCPVGLRLEELHPERREQLLIATDTSDSAPEALDWLATFLAKTVEPDLRALLTRSSLRAALQTERFRGARVTPPARSALALDSGTSAAGAGTRRHVGSPRVVVEPGPIPLGALQRFDDPDVERALEQFGFDPTVATFRLVEVALGELEDVRWLPGSHPWGTFMLDALRAGSALPPIVIVASARAAGTFALLDGLHRLHAHWQLAREPIRAYELIVPQHHQRRPR